MGIISKIFYTTSCLTIFAGTAYVAAVTLAPPPSYTVSNHDRLARYNALAVKNAYEKKTRSQEFYLGLTRWRRGMLREEGLLHGRVLEVGAGCGGNVPYYPSHYFTEEAHVQHLMQRAESEAREHQRHAATNKAHTSKDEAGAARDGVIDVAEASYALQQMEKGGMCDEIVLCDRAPNMVEACVQRVRSRLGYTPYRYPGYDTARIVAALRSHARVPHDAAPAAVRKRKVVHADGSVAAVYASPLQDDQERAQFLATHPDNNNNNNGNSEGGEEGGRSGTMHSHGSDGAAVPLLPDAAPGDRLPLLSAEGEAELRRRAAEIAARQSFRVAMGAALRSIVAAAAARNESREPGAAKRSERGGEAAREDSTRLTSKAHAATSRQLADPHTASTVAAPPLPAPPAAWRSAAVTQHTTASEDRETREETELLPPPQPLFSVANYAAEQLPFADNSFDTVVDMFGLCSYDDPVRALRELSRVCRPGGRLLLLEHGKGSAARVNTHLDKWAPRHAKSWGCWWNRDIRRIVRLSGLTVEKWNSKHFGTSHYIIAKPYKTMDEWDDYVRTQHNRNKDGSTTAAAAAAA